VTTTQKINHFLSSSQVGTMQFDQKLHDLFYKSHLKDLQVPDRKVLHLNTTDPAHKAFELISSEGVHSAPVFDPKIHKWVGLIDLKDFVKYILHLQSHKEMACSYHKITDDSRPVGEIMNISGDTVWLTVNDVQNLGELVQRMHLCRYHRLPVMSTHDPQKIHGMVSQIDIVTWLHKHIDDAGDSVQRPIKELGLTHAGKEVFSASLQTKLLDVYKNLTDKNIAGCPIVDAGNHLIGNLSVSDLKFKLFEELPNIEMTVEQFFKSQPARHFPIYVHEDSKLSEAIAQLAIAHVHRVFVCDAHRTLKGVITLSDVMRVVAQLIAKP